MARSVKRPRAEPQAFHQLGVRGRKTGVVLQDRGVRDQYGLPPVDVLFTSPQDTTSAPAEGSEDAGSVDMDIETSAGPGPQTLLKNQRNMRFPIPKSRSPIKTNLKSPAKKNPHLEHLSSPAPSSPSRSGRVDDRDVTVTRRLDFTAKPDKSRNSTGKPLVNGGAKSTARSFAQQIGQEPRSGLGSQPDMTMSDMVEQSLQMVDAMSDNYVGGNDAGDAGEDFPAADDGMGGGDQAEQLSSAKPSPVKSSPRRPPKPLRQSFFGSRKGPSLESVAESDEQAGNYEHPTVDEHQRQAKRPRTSAPPPNRQGTSTSRPAAASTGRPPSRAKSTAPQPPLKRKRGRPRKSEQQRRVVDDGGGDELVLEVQRAPPMPRSRGLVSFRRDSNGLTSNGLGRRSLKPVDYWAEDYPGIENGVYNGDLGFTNIKEVIQFPTDASASARAPRSKTRTAAKIQARQAVVQDEELEDWEMDEGTVTGEIVLWEPDHEVNPPLDDDQVQVMDDRLAISADAIQTTEIKDATFRFAKTLTLPFMGAGVVDLPPGSEKRLKNSRKMHMVFFVHYGKVLVTINETQFRLSAGGTWFVPRGNYYSIANEYENPCRIFFAQACEVAPQMEERPTNVRSSPPLVSHTGDSSVYG